MEVSSADSGRVTVIPSSQALQMVMKTVGTPRSYKFKYVRKSALQTYESMDAKEAFMYIIFVKQPLKIHEKHLVSVPPPTRRLSCLHLVRSLGTTKCFQLPWMDPCALLFQLMGGWEMRRRGRSIKIPDG